MPLFLFEAHFSDGSVLTQTPADRSQTDPDKNAFFDVLARIEDVVTFGLFSDDVPDTYAVDLRDGHFEINGRPFSAQDPAPELDFIDARYRLVWFKRHRHHVVTGADGPLHDIEYHIGWVATKSDGQEIARQTIAVRG